jgi:tetratricopeptide (TPR) repeat protein
MQTSESAAGLIDQADRAFRLGDLATARAAIRRACEISAGDPRPWLLRADVARASGDLADLIEALARAASLSRDAGLIANLQLDQAWALYGSGCAGQASDLAKRLDPTRLPPDRLGLLAGLLDAVGLSEKAEPVLRGLLQTQPANPAAWLQLGFVGRALGRSEDTVSACERAISLAPAMAQAHALLASSGRWSSSNNHVARLASLLDRTTDPLNRARLGYALFKEHDDLGQVSQAWTALQGAASAAATVYPWSAERDAAALQVLRDLAETVGASLEAPQDAAPRPIFVVGLPRSGTTLVDRVLAAHSRVASLGELNIFAQLADAGDGPRPRHYADLATVERMRSADWTAVGARYRQEVGLMAGGRHVVTDKNPQNWAYAGLIARALPNAVFVHVRRDPMDSLFGAYKQLFIREHAWSYDLASLVGHYRHYLSGTAHWRARLGSRWIEVDYKELATDPEVQIPRLLAACGLGFEVGCLHPEQGFGAVRTLSALQVREPINPRSIGGWRRYQAELEPLRQALEQVRPPDA